MAHSEIVAIARDGTIVAIVARVHNVGTRATVRPVPLGFETTRQYEPVRFCRRFRLLRA